MRWHKTEVTSTERREVAPVIPETRQRAGLSPGLMCSLVLASCFVVMDVVVVSVHRPDSAWC